MKRASLLVTDFMLFVILVIADQLTKHLAVVRLKNQAAYNLINGILEFNYLENRGAAFGVLQNQKYFFVILTVLVIGAALFYMVKNYQKSLWLVLSLILIISGGIGNFIDRVHLGYVVDMVQLDFIDFAIFNVADSYLTVGVLLLILILWKEENGSHH